MKNILICSLCLIFFASCHNLRPKGETVDGLAQDEQLLKQDEFAAIEPSSNAHYYFLRGEIYYADANFTEALRWYEKASALQQEESPALRSRLVQCYVRTGQLENALNIVEQASQKSPKDIPLMQLKAEILSALQRPQEAINTYQKIIDVNAKEDVSEEIYVLLASLYAQANKLDQGQAVLTELIKKNPKSAAGYYYSAKFFEAGRSVQQADRAYRKALELAGDNEAMQLDYVRFLAAQKRYREAVKICDKLIAKNADNVAAKKVKAQILLAEKKPVEAIKELEELGAQEDNPAETRMKIALIKLDSQDYDGAIVDLKLLLAKAPDIAALHYYLALAYAGQKHNDLAMQELDKIPVNAEIYGQAKLYQLYLHEQNKNYLQAKQVLEQLIAQKPDNSKLWVHKAAIEKELKDIPAAINSIRKALELEPTNDSLLFSLAIYLDQNGQDAESWQMLEKIISINSKNASALNYLGYSFAEQGVHLDRAMELINAALKIEPNNGYYLDSRAWVYYKQGLYVQAEADLKRALTTVNDDAVILEHMAVILQQQKKYAEAKTYVDKAAAHVASSEDENVGQRIKALSEKLEKELKGTR
ncbi:MAG: tetratricopeptide repeat protein [Deltaproteobacteria bacterium]|nr:tetratricopeptide repeat protein [Deltaproteobacteria bacterium]